MKKLLLLLAAHFFYHALTAQTISTVFEKSNGNSTPTYFEIIDWWKKLDKQSAKVTVLQKGDTDAGLPLHLVMVSNDGITDIKKIKQANKRIVFVNNGIHPGEPDGIDASMLLVRDIVANKYKLPDNIVLAIIPVYNIGGCLNRGENYRVDQEGPDAFGSRGNSQNLDLNRDFIKNDSKEARSFAQIFHELDADVFVDNHVSNGADYQHIITLLPTQHNKLGGDMGAFLQTAFQPALYTMMQDKGFDLVPYVNHWSNRKVEEGWNGFWDSPRYSTGYAALWQTFSFMPETHMLKPYKQRVAATYALMQSFIAFTAKNSATIKQLRTAAKEAVKKQAQFPIAFQHDTTVVQTITFKGFESGYKPSSVSGLPRLYYDRNKPFTKQIPHYNEFKTVKEVEKPTAYIIPQGWWKVVERLQVNKVQMHRLTKDTLINVQVYRIEKYNGTATAYEAHHVNTNVEISTLTKAIQFRKGDWYIPMNQVANRFLIETLEPEAEDSYFAWNFFDGILGQKEGYSAYVFEDKAAAILEKNAALKKQLLEKQQTDSQFAKSARAQLDFIFKQTPYYEPEHLRYPVYRVK
jgi:hypothetical protein